MPNRRAPVLARRLDAHARVRLDEFGARQLAHRDDDVARLGGHRTDDDGDAAPDDAGFLRGNRGERVAEILLVIEIDRGDGRRDGLHDVRRVEASAEADFEHRDIHARAPEDLEGDRCGHLEEGRRRFERSFREQVVDQPPHVFDQFDEHGRVDRRAVDRKALFEADEVRRGVAADLQARRAQRAVGHGRHRPFAVRAGDENAFELRVGMAERRCERLDVREAELDAELFERQQVLERIHIYGSADSGLSPRLHRFDRMLPHESKRSRDGALHFAAIDDEVEHAMLEQKLAALKSLGQLLANRLLDDARAGKADERAGLGNVQIAEHREARGDAARGRIRQNRDVGNVLLIEPRERRADFRHLHQRQARLPSCGRRPSTRR